MFEYWTTDFYNKGRKVILSIMMLMIFFFNCCLMSELYGSTTDGDFTLEEFTIFEEACNGSMTHYYDSEKKQDVACKILGFTDLNSNSVKYSKTDQLYNETLVSTWIDGNPIATGNVLFYLTGQSDKLDLSSSNYSYSENKTEYYDLYSILQFVPNWVDTEQYRYTLVSKTNYSNSFSGTNGDDSLYQYSTNDKGSIYYGLYYDLENLRNTYVFEDNNFAGFIGLESGINSTTVQTAYDLKVTSIANLYSTKYELYSYMVTHSTKDINGNEVSTSKNYTSYYVASDSSGNSKLYFVYNKDEGWFDVYTLDYSVASTWDDSTKAENYAKEHKFPLSEATEKNIKTNVRVYYNWDEYEYLVSKTESPATTVYDYLSKPADYNSGDDYVYFDNQQVDDYTISYNWQWNYIVPVWKQEGVEAFTQQWYELQSEADAKATSQGYNVSDYNVSSKSTKNESLFATKDTYTQYTPTAGSSTTTTTKPTGNLNRITGVEYQYKKIKTVANTELVSKGTETIKPANQSKSQCVWGAGTGTQFLSVTCYYGSSDANLKDYTRYKFNWTATDIWKFTRQSGSDKTYLPTSYSAGTGYTLSGVTAYAYNASGVLDSTLYYVKTSHAVDYVQEVRDTYSWSKTGTDNYTTGWGSAQTYNNSDAWTVSGNTAYFRKTQASQTLYNNYYYPYTYYTGNSYSTSLPSYNTTKPTTYATAANNAYYMTYTTSTEYRGHYTLKYHVAQVNIKSKGLGTTSQSKYDDSINYYIPTALLPYNFSSFVLGSSCTSHSTSCYYIRETNDDYLSDELKQITGVFSDSSLSTVATSGWTSQLGKRNVLLGSVTMNYTTKSFSSAVSYKGFYDKSFAKGTNYTASTYSFKAYTTYIDTAYTTSSSAATTLVNNDINYINQLYTNYNSSKVASTYTSVQQTRTIYNYTVYSRGTLQSSQTVGASYTTSGEWASVSGGYAVRQSIYASTQYRYTCDTYTWQKTSTGATFSGGDSFYVLSGATADPSNAKYGSGLLNADSSSLTTANGNPANYTAKYDYYWKKNGTSTLYSYTAYKREKDTAAMADALATAKANTANYNANATTVSDWLNNGNGNYLDQTNGYYYVEVANSRYKTYNLYRTKVNGYSDSTSSTAYATKVNLTSTSRANMETALTNANNSKTLPTAVVASTNTAGTTVSEYGTNNTYSAYTGVRFEWTGTVRYTYTPYTIATASKTLYRYDNTWRASWVTPGTANYTGYTGITVNNGTGDASYKTNDTLSGTGSTTYAKCSSTTPTTALYYDSAVCYLHNSTVSGGAKTTRTMTTWSYKYKANAVLDSVKADGTTYTSSGSIANQNTNTVTLSHTNYIPSNNNLERRICSASNSLDYNCYKLTNTNRQVTTYYKYDKHVISYKTTKTKKSTINGLSNGYYDTGYIYKGSETITKTNANGTPTTKNVLDEFDFFDKMTLSTNTIKYFNKSNLDQLVLENLDTSSSTTDYAAYTLTGLKANTTYTLSVNGYKSASGLNGKVEVVGKSTVYTTLGTSAATKTVSFTSDANGRATINVYVSTSTTKGYIYINWMQVELGSSATTYLTYKTYEKQSTRTNTYYEYFKFNTVHTYYKASDDKTKYPNGGFSYDVNTFIVSYQTKNGTKKTNTTSNSDSFEHQFVVDYIAGNVNTGTIMVGYDFNKNGSWDSNEYWYYRDTTNEVAAKIENGIVTFKYNVTTSKNQFYYQERRRVLLDVSDLNSYFTVSDYTANTPNEGDIVIPLDQLSSNTSVINAMKQTGSSTNKAQAQLPNGNIIQVPIDSTLGKYQLLKDYISDQQSFGVSINRSDFVYNATTQTFHYNKGNTDKYYQFSILIDTNKDLSGKKLESGYSLVINDSTKLQNIFGNSNYFAANNSGLKNGYVAPLGQENITETVTNGNLSSTEVVANMLTYIQKTDDKYGILVRSNVTNYSNKLFVTLNGTSYKLTSEDYKFLSYIEVKNNGYWEDKVANDSPLSSYIEYNKYINDKYKYYVFNDNGAFITTWAKDLSEALNNLPEYNIDSNSLFATLSSEEIFDYMSKNNSSKMKITSSTGVTVYIPIDNYFNLTGNYDYIYELAKMTNDFKFVNYIDLNSLDEFYMDDNAMGSTWLMYQSNNTDSPYADVLEKSLQHSLTKVNDNGVVGFKIHFNGMNNYWYNGSKYTLNGGSFSVYDGEGSSKYKYTTDGMHNSTYVTNLVTAVPQLEGATEKNATVSSALFTTKYENGTIVSNASKTVDIPEFIMLNSGRKSIDFVSSNSAFNLIQTGSVNSYDTYALYAVSYNQQYTYYTDYIEGLVKVFNAIYERTRISSYFFTNLDSKVSLLTKDRMTCSSMTYNYCLTEEEYEIYSPVIYNQSYRLSLATSVLLNLNFDGSKFSIYDATAIQGVINQTMGSIAEINDLQTYYSVLYFYTLINGGYSWQIDDIRTNNNSSFIYGPYQYEDTNSYPSGILPDSYALNADFLNDFCQYQEQNDYFVNTCLDNYIVNGQYPISLDYKDAFKDGHAIFASAAEDMIKQYMSVKNMIQAVKSSWNASDLHLVYAKTDVEGLNLVYRKLSKTDMIRDQFVNTIVVDSEVNNGTFMNNLGFYFQNGKSSSGEMKLDDFEESGTISLVATLGDYVPQNYYLELNQNKMMAFELEFSASNFNTGSLNDNVMLTNDILGTTGINSLSLDVENDDASNIIANNQWSEIQNRENNRTYLTFNYSKLSCYLVSGRNDPSYKYFGNCDNTHSGAEIYNYYAHSALAIDHYGEGEIFDTMNTNYYFYTFYGLNFDINGIRNKERTTNSYKKASVIPVPISYDYVYTSKDNKISTVYKGSWMVFAPAGLENAAEYEKKGPRSLKYANYYARNKFLPHVLDYMYNNFGTYSDSQTASVASIDEYAVSPLALDDFSQTLGPDISVEGGGGTTGGSTSSNSKKFILNTNYKSFYMNQIFLDNNFSRMYYYDYTATNPHSYTNASYQEMLNLYSNPVFGYTLHYSLDPNYNESMNNMDNLLTNQNVFYMKNFKDNGTTASNYSNYWDYAEALSDKYGAYYELHPVFNYRATYFSSYSTILKSSNNFPGFVANVSGYDNLDPLNHDDRREYFYGTQLLSSVDQFNLNEKFENDLHVWIDFGEENTQKVDSLLNSFVDFEGDVTLNDTDSLRGKYNFALNVKLPGVNTSGFVNNSVYKEHFQNYELQLFYETTGTTCIEGYNYYNGKCYFVDVGNYGYDTHITNTLITYKVKFEYTYRETYIDNAAYQRCEYKNQIDMTSVDCTKEATKTRDATAYKYVTLSSPNVLDGLTIENNAKAKLDGLHNYKYVSHEKIENKDNANFGYWNIVEVNPNQTLTITISNLLPNTKYYVLVRARYINSLVSNISYLSYDTQRNETRLLYLTDSSVATLINSPSFATGDDMVRNPYGTITSPISSCAGSVCNGDNLLKNELIPVWLSNSLYSVPTAYSQIINDTTSQEFANLQAQGWTAGYEQVMDSGIFPFEYDGLESSAKTKYVYSNSTGKYHLTYNLSHKYMLHLTAPQVIAVRIGLNSFDNEYKLIGNHNQLNGKFSFIEGNKTSTVQSWNSATVSEGYLVYTLNETNGDFSSKLLFESENTYFDERLLNYKVYNILVNGNSLMNTSKIYNVVYQNKFDNTYAYIDYDFNNKLDTKVSSTTYYNYYGEATNEENLFSKYKDAYWETTWREELESDGSLSFRKFIQVDGFTYLAHIRDGKVDSIIVPDKK